MRCVPGLAWRLLRGGGRRGALGAVLTWAAVAVSTGLLLFAVGAVHAFAERADADAWRHRAETTGPATAVLARSTDHVRGRPITVVELAALDGRAPVPPGMARFPRPGETWVSPALGRLIRELPADQLGRRFGAPPAGTLGRDALEHPAELVAVVGRHAGDPTMTAPREERVRGWEPVASPARIDAFDSGAVSLRSQIYRALMVIAAVLMVVPLLVFGGAAARLTVARRDERLAALRLVGATPGQVVALTTTEAVLTAAAGSLAGALVYAASVPALGRIPVGGGRSFTGDLWPGALPVAGVLVAVPLLVGVSAIAGLRRVVVSPLGVAQRVTPPALRAVRLIALVVLVLAFGIVGGGLAGMGNAGLVILLVFLALAFLGLNLVGPWVAALLGRAVVGTARGPAWLLAGRRLVDDPRSAWRTVAGIALGGFVAGFLSLLNPSVTGTGPADRLELAVPPERSAAVAARAGKRLEGLGARISVTRGTGGGPAGGGPAGGGANGGAAAAPAIVAVTVPGGAAAIDRARTALTGLVPGQVATTPADMGAERHLVADLRTGSLTVLTVSFLIAVASAGITGASSVLDRRETYATLRLAGTPPAVLDRARLAETLVPLAVMGGGSLLTGVFFALPFAAEFGYAGAWILGAFVLAGGAAVLGASALSRPLLRSVTTDPAPVPD
ncbi:ABC transporter permease [Actinomadura viridis]|uniref:ABC transporter permease n=1 Tax=Actinomadura viridis TaxID=58110 RepID=UPI0036BB0706